MGAVGPRGESGVRGGRDLPDRVPAGVADRFWAKVVCAPGQGHWIFTGAVSSPDGYGRVTFTQCGRQYCVSAHRFALWIAGVDIREPDMVAEHRCNEPLCVRVHPTHLVASTYERNITYARLTGRLRGPRGGADSGWRTRHQRSLDVRAAVAGGWDPDAYARAARPVTNPLEQPTLF